MGPSDRPKHAWANIRPLEKSDHFICEDFDGTTSGDGRFYGGHLISQAVYCAYKTVPAGFDINSFHSYFVRTGSGRVPIVYAVKRIRDGRNFAFRSVQLLQRDEVILHCEFTFRRRPDKTEVKITHARFPSVPDPERLESVETMRNKCIEKGIPVRDDLMDVAFLDLFWKVDARPCNGIEYVLGPQRPTLKQCIWVKYGTDKAALDSNYNFLALSFLSDIGLAYTGAMPYPNTQFKIFFSLDHSGWVHETNFDMNEFLLFEQELVMHSNGKSLVHGRLWTRDGQLVASFSQEALVVPIKSTDARILSKL